MCPLSIKKVGFVKILKEYKKEPTKINNSPSM
jgi:hypothetical protein